jgi:uncharacterized protein (DUF427 family)
MKAVVDGQMVAQSDDVIENHGYQYFPRIAVRAAWSYEAPRPEMASVGGRFGFWEDVKVS